MAFGRDILLEIQNNNVSVTQISNLDISFNIERSKLLAANTAEFVIYNAKSETRQNILKSGNNIIFKAGYKDENNIAAIFFGTISEAISVKKGTEWTTTLLCQDISGNKQPLTHSTISLSYIAGSPLIQIISDIKTALNIPVFGIENITNTLNNGFTYTGSINGLLRKIKLILEQQEIGIFFDSSQMVLYKFDGRDSKFGLTTISPTSGLIENVVDVTNDNKGDGKKRIKLKSLINPKLQPLGLIQVTSENVNGVFLIEKLQFVGNNFGGDFIVTVEAVE